jgi:hypothetical protein
VTKRSHTRMPTGPVPPGLRIPRSHSAIAFGLNRLGAEGRQAGAGRQGGASKQSHTDSSAPRAKPQHSQGRSEPAKRLHKHARTRELGRKISGYLTAPERERRRCARLLHERAERARTPACTRLAAYLCALLIALAFPPSAQAAFSIETFEVSATEANKTPDTHAGSHPFQLTTTIAFGRSESSAGQPGEPFTEADLRDLQIEEPPGLIENPAALSQCSQAQFNTSRSSPFEASLSGESCPDASQIGVVTVQTSFGAGATRSFGLYNLAPPPGTPSQFGFNAFGAPIAFTPQLTTAAGEYRSTLDSAGFPQLFDLYGLQLTLWGTPWSLAHNPQRGNCLNEADPTEPWGKCSVGRPAFHPAQAYLTLPASCGTPLSATLRAESWQQPGAPATATTAFHDAQGRPLALGGCNLLAFNPTPTARLSSARASSPSGFDLIFEQPIEGLTNPLLTVPTQVNKALVALPQGITINPSFAAGLGVCTPAAYAAETATSPPGAGCPNAAKIGDFTVTSPLFAEPLAGAVFLAQPDNPASGAHGAENPFDSLLALYLVAKAPQRGVIVKLAGEIEADPSSGQLITSFENLPQLPYSRFEVSLREGQRSPLLTPAACGAYTTAIDLSPWRNPEASLAFNALFHVNSGIEGSACPTDAAAPFLPAAQAGTLNSNAGSYTPFYLHLTRADTEQEITSYSTLLPPGLLGKIADIPYCPEADIEAATEKTGSEEIEEPSCPAASQIGHTVSGYGVGPVLAYAPGGLYLAGPYHGSAFSIVAIDSATVGPLDLGVIVIRSAIRVDPQTAQVSIDSAGSDPIPHIRDGIPLHLRDVRIYLNRPGLMRNPTSCERSAVSSALTGSAAPFTNPADITATASAPFQVSNCASLGFAPKLALRLRGPTAHGAHPQLSATVTPRPGDANIGAAAVTLPPSEFLEQANIRAVCTVPQLEAEACPARSIYGQASAVTPLLAEPLQGPVYLRSAPESASGLPDLAAVLRGAGIRILIDGRIDSSRGGIRASFSGLPDAPLTRFTMTIFGGKGILANGEDLCAAPQIASARLIGQDNSGEIVHPRLAVSCHAHRRANSHRRGGRR